MADVLIDNQSAPTTPASGKSVLYVDSTTKKVAQRDDGGTDRGLLSKNVATGASQALGTGDTYVTNSGILVPSMGMQAGQTYRHYVWISKTAASTAAAVFTWRLGTNQTTADTSRASITSAAQTAVVDSGLFMFTCVVRSVGASGQLVVAYSIAGKRAADAVGFGNNSLSNVPATFDNSAVAGNYLSITINAGASSAWTVDQCFAELVS